MNRGAQMLLAKVGPTWFICAQSDGDSILVEGRSVSGEKFHASWTAGKFDGGWAKLIPSHPDFERNVVPVRDVGDVRQPGENWRPMKAIELRRFVA